MALDWICHLAHPIRVEPEAANELEAVKSFATDLIASIAPAAI